MFTLTGAIIGFIAMLAARGRAGIAAGLALLGLVFALAGHAVFTWENIALNWEQEDPIEGINWSAMNWLVGILAAAPGVLGALLARRD